MHSASHFWFTILHKVYLYDIKDSDACIIFVTTGANNCRPSNLCYEAMGGENADFIGSVTYVDISVQPFLKIRTISGWEQSFNCGRSRDVFELIARVAHWSKGVAYYSASGAFLPSGCSPSKVVAFLFQNINSFHLCAFYFVFIAG